MSATRTVIGLLRASHPEPAAAVTIGSALLAVITGRDARGVVAVAAAVLASQLAVGWHNDWLDAARDAKAGRRDKPIVTGLVSRRAVGISALIAAIVMVPFALLSGPAAALVAVIGLAASLSYNWPLKSTPLSVLPYVISFAALPTFVVLGLPGSPLPPWWLVAAGAALGGGGHFANVISDLDDDARTGIHGLPHRLGPTWSAIAAALLLGATSVLLVFGPAGPASAAGMVGLCAAVGVLLIGGYGQLRSPRSRSAFRAVLIAALINVALLLTAGAVV